MPRLKLRSIYKGAMPTGFEVREFLGARRLRRTTEVIRNDSEAPEGFVDYPMLDADHSTATLVSSRLDSPVDYFEMHMPAIDIDRECMLVPSSKEGHFHLFINVKMELDEYVELLEVMSRVGIVQRGFYQYAKQRGQSFVRYPGITKSNEQERIDDNKMRGLDG